MMKKLLYAAPETEVLELHLEGNVLQAVSETGTGNESLVDDPGSWS